MYTLDERGLYMSKPMELACNDISNMLQHSVCGTFRRAWIRLAGDQYTTVKITRDNLRKLISHLVSETERPMTEWSPYQCYNNDTRLAYRFLNDSLPIGCRLNITPQTPLKQIERRFLYTVKNLYAAYCKRGF